MVVTRLSENKSGSRTKTDGNTLTIGEKRRNNRNTEMLQNKTANIHRNEQQF